VVLLLSAHTEYSAFSLQENRLQGNIVPVGRLAPRL